MVTSIDFKQATVKLRDNTSPTKKTLEVKLGEGNLTYDEKRNIIYDKDRGKLGSTRKGDEEPMDVSLNARWIYTKASSGGTETVEDVLKNRGEASDWVSTSSDLCEPFCVDIVVEYIPLCSADEKEEVVLPKFRYESIKHDYKAGMLDISGKCNATEATVTRSAQS